MSQPKDIIAPAPALLTGATSPERAEAGHSMSRFPLALATALAAHVAAVALVLWHVPLTAGADGLDRDAISINVIIVPATAVETRTPTAAAVPAVAGAIDSDPGQATAAPSPPEAADAQPPEPPRPKPPDVAKDEPSPLKTAAVIMDEPPPETEPHHEPTPPPTVAAVPAAPASAPAAALGGLASVGVAETAPAAAAPATAAPGVAERYARSVAEALGKIRPKGATAGQRGTVKVTFAIADDGALKFARITASSGSDSLDTAALSAVRRVAFPAPPSGLSHSQLTYEIPYRFR